MLLLIRNALAKLFAGCLFVLLLWGLVLVPLRGAWLQLSDLTRASGPVRTATIERSTGKNSRYYLALMLTSHAQRFGIWAEESEQPLRALQARLPHGMPVTVYYAPDQLWPWPEELKFSVYQVETPGGVLYPWEETHQRCLNRVAVLLVLSCVVGLPLLHFVLRNRAAS